MQEIRTRGALALAAALASAGLPPAYGHSPDPAADKAAIQEIESGAFIGGNFVLKDQHGGTVTEQALLGKLSIVYFGYTFCPRPNVSLQYLILRSTSPF